MKTILIIVVGLAVICSNTMVSAVSDEPLKLSNMPTASGIAIDLGERHFTIAELTHTGLEYLWSHENVGNDELFSVTVIVSPKDKSTMCEMWLGQGFGKTSWKIVFGYDGKVKNATGALAVEEHHK